MEISMRAKLVIESVTQYEGTETLKFNAIGRSGSYPDDGFDEDNTFAKFTPSAKLEMCITNKALHGKFVAGEKYYVDFTKVVEEKKEG